MNRIIAVPLDDRPVGTAHLEWLAATAGVELSILPPELRPAPGGQRADRGRVRAWTTGAVADPEVGALILSWDQWLHGGYVPMRRTDESMKDWASAISVLRQIRAARPDLAILVGAIIPRTLDANVADAEPFYWARHGRAFASLSAAMFRHQTGGGPRPVTSIPDSLVQDWLGRRREIHASHLAALDLVEDGTIDYLAVGVEDAPPESVSALDRRALQERIRANAELSPKADVHPGGDELTAVLLARALASRVPGPTVQIIWDNPSAGSRVAPWEDEDLRQTLAGQLATAGVQPHAPTEERSDMTLAVVAGQPATAGLQPHAPTQERPDMTLTTVAGQLAIAGGPPHAPTQERPDILLAIVAGQSPGRDHCSAWADEEAGPDEGAGAREAADHAKRPPKHANCRPSAREEAARGGRLRRTAFVPDPDPGHLGPEADLAVVLDQLQQARAAGTVVGVADVSHPNGACPELVSQLAQRDMLETLDAYAGWNTAGNSIGSALAQAVAAWRGGDARRGEARAMVARHIMDAWAYQTQARPLIAPSGALDSATSRRMTVGGSRRMTEGATRRMTGGDAGACQTQAGPLIAPSGALDSATSRRMTVGGSRRMTVEPSRNRVAEDLMDRACVGLDREAPGGWPWRPRAGTVRLPWGRVFEVEFQIERTGRTGRDGGAA